jgi:hypothetical protein
MTAASPMTDAEYQAALDRVRVYARKIRDGEQAVDQESLDRAADLAALYEDKRWVAELEAEGKAPKTKVFRGRPVDPESRNRFASWALTHEGLGPSYTGKLLKAHQWRTNYSDRVRVIPTEKAVRPLYALERRGYGDHTPEVVARAQEIAGDGQQVTSAHTRQAVSEFWAKFTRGETRRMDRDAQAKQHATRMRREAMWLVENGYLKTFADLLTELDAVGEKAAS